MEKNSEISKMFSEEELDSNKTDKKKNMFEQTNEFLDNNDEENYPKQSKVLEDPEEFNHFKEIVSSFFNYQVDSLRDVARIERDFNSLSEDHRNRLKYKPSERIEKLRRAIFKNYLFLLKIVQPHSHMFKFFRTVK
jgi:hypothetical protein